MGFGVLAGRNSPVNSCAIMPGIPSSTAVGMSGTPLSRSGAVTARMRILPARCSSTSWPVTLMVAIWIWPATRSASDEIGDARPGAAIRHMGDIRCADLELEQLTGELRHGAGAGGAVGQLVRVGLGVGDELLQILCRH